MITSFDAQRRPGRALTFACVLAAVASGAALVNPQSSFGGGQGGRTSEPEIIRGLASPAATTQRARVPEIVSGLVSPVVSAPPARTPEIIGGLASPAAPDQLLIGRSLQTERPASPSGFNWDDAGIGATSAFVLVLLAGGIGVAVRRRRHGSPQLPDASALAS
jgi:hypothetical protein